MAEFGSESMEESLGSRLRIARTELGLTQAEAASAMGITQPMLHRAETSLGLRSNHLVLILNYYINDRKINPAWLLSEPNTAFQILSNGSRIEDTADQKLRLLSVFLKDLNDLDQTGN